jgi:hypothetical protein
MMLAEKLGMTLCELRQRMTHREMLLWGAFYELQADQQAATMKQANNQRR